jgi:hypothetical protein
MCIYMCVHIYIHVCKRLYVYIYIYECIFTYLYIWMYIGQKQEDLFETINAYDKPIFICMYIYISIYLNICSHIFNKYSHICPHI